MLDLPETALLTAHGSYAMVEFLSRDALDRARAMEQGGMADALASLTWPEVSPWCESERPGYIGALVFMLQPLYVERSHISYHKGSSDVRSPNPDHAEYTLASLATDEQTGTAPCETDGSSLACAARIGHCRPLFRLLSVRKLLDRLSAHTFFICYKEWAVRFSIHDRVMVL